MAFRQRLQRRLPAAVHLRDVRRVRLRERHRHKIRQRCDLLLSVRHERPELVQIIQLTGRQDLRRRILPAGKAFSDGHEVRTAAVFMEQIQLRRPQPRLDFIVHDRDVMRVADRVRPMDIVVRQTDAAVVHEDELMEESGHFRLAAIILRHKLFKCVGVIDRNRHDLQEASRLHARVQFMPHAAEQLCENRRAMVVRLLPAAEIAHDEKHRRASMIFRFRELRLKLVEAGQHHFQGGLAGQAARLQIDDAVQHMAFTAGEHRRQPVRVVFRETVRRADQFAFQFPRDEAARIVVRHIRDADLLRDHQQTVARKVLSKRRLVMFALADDGQPSVLLKPVRPHARQRRGVQMRVRTEGVRRRPRVAVRERFANLFATLRQQVADFFRIVGGPEFHLFTPQRLQRLFIAQPQRRGRAAHGVHIFRAKQINQ